MTIQSFSEKAIKGGYGIAEVPEGYAVFAALLDPSAWKAVGVTERWAVSERRDKWLGLFHALWDEKTIEQYLETL